MAKTLQTQSIHDKIVPTKGDFALCPKCHQEGFSTRLIRMDETTKADHLPLYCRRCKREFLVNIDQGRCQHDQSQ